MERKRVGVGADVKGDGGAEEVSKRRQWDWSLSSSPWGNYLVGVAGVGKTRVLEMATSVGFTLCFFLLGMMSMGVVSGIAESLFVDGQSKSSVMLDDSIVQSAEEPQVMRKRAWK